MTLNLYKKFPPYRFFDLPGLLGPNMGEMTCDFAILKAVEFNVNILTSKVT